MSRGNQCLPLCRLSPNLVTFHHDLASVPLGKVSREIFSVDELHPFTKSSETGLGYTANSTAWPRGIRQVSIGVHYYK